MGISIEGSVHFGVPSIAVSGSQGSTAVSGAGTKGFTIEKLEVGARGEVVFVVDDGNSIRDLLGSGEAFLQLIADNRAGESLLQRTVSFLQREKQAVKVLIYLNLKENILLLARDQFGLVPLFYTLPSAGKIFFSSNLAYLLKNSGGVIDLDKSAIADYLEGRDNRKPYTSHTFYKNIKAVLPGSVGELTLEGCSSTTFGTITPSKWEHLKTDEDFAEVQRRLYAKSLQNLTGNQLNVGAHLSGGLDSSSNVGVFRNLYPDRSLKCFFHETLTEATDEFTYAKEVAADVGSQLHVVNPGNDHLDAVYLMTRIVGQPVTMINSPVLHLDTLRSVKDNGCDLLLTGHGGDNVVGYGFGYLDDLLARQSWKELKQAFRGFASNDLLAGLHPGWHLFPVKKKEQLIALHYYGRKTRKLLRNGALIGYFKALAEAKVRLDLPLQMVLSKNWQSMRAWLRHRFSGFPKTVAAGTSNLEIYSGLDAKDTYPFDLLYEDFVRINEEFFLLGNHFNIEICHPFIDPELYEFCSSVPDRVKFGNGLARAHHRAAMKGLLPESVRLRTGKAYFADYAFRSLLELYHQSEDLLNRSDALWEFVDKSKFETAIAMLETDGPKMQQSDRNFLEFRVTRVIFLAVWLDLVKSGSFV